MKAWVGRELPAGTDYHLEEFSRPEAGSHELVLRVRAIGINRVDQRPKTSHFSHTAPAPAAIPGLEAAGEVVEVGPDASDWRVGDRAMAMVQGGAAEFVRVNCKLAMKVPVTISWADAGAIPVSYLTAYDAMVMRGHIKAGDHLLIHAVTSGVGIACVQLGKLLSAASIGGSSTSKAKLAQAMEAGLAYGILDPYRGFAQETVDATGGHGADVIVDNIGGSILDETLRAAAFGARIIDVGRMGGTKAELDLDRLAMRRASLIGVTFRTRSLDEHAEICARFMTDHGRDLAEGHLKPVLSKTFDFSDFAAAAAFARVGSTYGKVVVTL